MTKRLVWRPPMRSLFALLPVIILAGLAIPACAVAVGSGGSLAQVAILVSAQFFFLYALLYGWFRRRLTERLANLAHEADRMAEGRFDAPTAVGGGDEVGRLAAAIDRMRRTVGDHVAESAALFDAAPVGLILVRNRVIERANRRAEILLGASRGGLAGTSAESIYRSHGDFVDVGARAYGTIERGEVFAEPLTLTRRDGSVFPAEFSGCALDPARPQDGSVWAIAPARPMPG